MVLIIFNLKVYYNTIYRCLNHGYTKLTAVLFYYYNMNVIAISPTSSIEMSKSLLLYGSITQQSNPKATIKSKNYLYYISLPIMRPDRQEAISILGWFLQFIEKNQGACNRYLLWIIDWQRSLWLTVSQLLRHKHVVFSVVFSTPKLIYTSNV